MSGHEFEKQVRQKLNDLKMTPSAESWENIENRLHERKRRPVAFYWVPLLLIGLATGGYLYLNIDQKSVLSDKNSTSNVKVQPNSESAAGTTVTGKDVNVPKVLVPGKEESSGNRLSSKSKDVTAIALNNPRQQKILTPGNEDGSGAIIQKSLQVNQQNAPVGKNLSLKISDFPVGAVPASSLNSLKSLSGPTVQTQPTSTKKINKWSYGLNGYAGISAVNEGHILNFNNAQVEDVSQVPSFAPIPAYKPSSISPGFSFSAGAFVKRDLNKTFSLSLALNYLQINTRNKVGSEVNGSQLIVNNGSRGYMMIANFFTVDQDKPSEYRNRYHFIEVPVELHTKINKSKKTPIHFNTGVAVSQLLKSNSLHFDGTTGVYYKNDELLNKTQVALKAGLTIELLNKTKRPIWLGPSARYNVTKILQEDVAAKKNFMLLGIDVKMFIK